MIYLDQSVNVVIVNIMGNTCGCEITVVNRQGDKGDKGDRGLSAYDVAVLNGFVGTEQEWLNTIGEQPLNWTSFPLINGWTANTPVFFAVRNNILYLRGSILHTTLTVGTSVFWDSATVAVPSTTSITQGMGFENVTSLVVRIQLLGDGTVKYQGPDVANVLLDLETATPIKLYL